MPNPSGHRSLLCRDDREQLHFLETSPTSWFSNSLTPQYGNPLPEKHFAAPQSTHAALHRLPHLTHPAADEPVMFALWHFTGKEQ